MSPMNIFRPSRTMRLLQADLKNISRDPTLSWATVLLIIPTAGAAIWREHLNRAAFGAFGLTDIVGYALPVLLVLPAFLIGWIIGFLLLEDRDDGPLLALEITPPGKSGYMLYRLALAASVTALITLFNYVLLAPDMFSPLGLLVLVLISIDAMGAAIVLPAIARNKVEGLAVTKITNIGSILPWFALIPSPLRYIAGFMPTFWIGELLQISDQQYLPFFAIALFAIGTHLAMVWVLYRLFAARLG